MVAVELLVSVMFCGALGVPTWVLPKVKVVGAIVGAAIAPVTESGMVNCAAFETMVMAAVSAPATDG